jgi:para-nitrobenzyl esterase
MTSHTRNNIAARSLRRKALSVALVATGLAAASTLAYATGDHGGSDRGPVVKTDKGAVRGFEKNGVYTFLGIPYAAPPVGNLRWRPPAPAKKWDGTLDATEFGNPCPQVTELGPFAGPTSITEDCLYLNVFTTGRSHNKKPVIVWIHGGGNVSGATNDYDGSKLATGGPSGTPTVAVTINYRMGLYGFLSHPALNSEGHPWGNYGILDTQAALRWVQRNIEAFGGDPDNVTLGGQSAGAIDTTANLISPAAAGLFHRAITQSSPIANLWFTSAATALSRGNAFAAAAGCPGSGSSAAACLRALSSARVLQLQGTPNANGPFVNGPLVDGTIVSMPPETAWTTGAYHKMPILGGTTKDELTFGLAIGEYFSQPQAALTPAAYNANNSAAVLAEYPLSNYGGNPTAAQNRVISDPFKCNGIRVLEQQASTNGSFGVYGYDFTYERAPFYFPRMPNPYDATGFFQALAYHTADIQFVFPKWHGGHLGVNLDPLSGLPRDLQGAELALSNQIVAAWTKFARYGNPNGSGNSPWPRMPQLLKQDLTNSVITAAQFKATYKCAFWGTP